MTNLETVANPAVITTVVLSACALGIGFMVAFFFALAREEKNTRPACALRPRGVHSEPNVVSAALPSRMPAVSPAAYVAMGVVRITTALATNAGRRNSDFSFDQLQAVGLGQPSPEVSLPGHRRYRSS